jgi:hypothetical protein
MHFSDDITAEEMATVIGDVFPTGKKDILPLHLSRESST